MSSSVMDNQRKKHSEHIFKHQRNAEVPVDYSEHARGCLYIYIYAYINVQYGHLIYAHILYMYILKYVVIYVYCIHAYIHVIK